MNDSAREWLLDGMRALGAEVDHDGAADGASVLFEPHTAAIFGAGEFCTLDFAPGRESPRPGMIMVSEKWYETLAGIASERGRTSAIRIATPRDMVWPSSRRASGFLRVAEGKTVFTEARVMDRMLMTVYVRCAAVADEKREFICGTAIDMSSLTALPDLPAALEKFLLSGKNDAAIPAEPAEASPSHFEALAGSLNAEMRLMLADFNESLAKRRDRDAQRIYHYYDELHRTVSTGRSSRKQDPAARRERFEAIAAEYARKLDDLRIKYLTHLSIEPVCMLQITVPSLVAWFDVFMGSNRITRPISWNFLTGSVDRSFCAGCGGYITETAHVCRKLHWLCSECMKTCPGCGRDLCIVCRPEGCSCGAGKS